MPEEYKLKPTEGFVNYDPEGQLGRQCKQKEKKKRRELRLGTETRSTSKGQMEGKQLVEGKEQ